MRRVRRLAPVLVLVASLSACWPAPGAGPDRRSYNPFERVLTPAAVPRLAEAFRVPLELGAGPPVVTRAGLFVRTGVRIAALDPTTGALRWLAWLHDSPPGQNEDRLAASDPYVRPGDTQVVASVTAFTQGNFQDPQLVTLDAATGAVLARRGANGKVGSLRGTRAAAIRQENNSAEWNFRWIGVHDLDGAGSWGGITNDTGDGPVTLAGDRLLVASGSRVEAFDTTVACPPYSDEIDLPTCPAAWVFPGAGPVTPVVVGDDDTLYVGAGSLYALHASSGGIRWFAELGATVSQAPALAGSTLFVATVDGRLSALAADGCPYLLCRSVWTTPTGSPIPVQPAVAGGVVYVGSDDGTLRAFDAAGCAADVCSPIWTADAGAPVTGGLAVYGSHLYVGTAASLVAYALPT